MGGRGRPATFERMSPEDVMNNIFNRDAQIEIKDVELSQSLGATTQAENMVEETQNNVIMYDLRKNNCATNCAKVLESGGYTPPEGATSILPQRLYEWFKKQD